MDIAAKSNQSFWSKMVLYARHDVIYFPSLTISAHRKRRSRHNTSASSLALFRSCPRIGFSGLFASDVSKSLRMTWIIECVNRSRLFSSVNRVTTEESVGQQILPRVFVLSSLVLISSFRTPKRTNAHYTPPTPTRRNCFVVSASAVWTQFATSSRRLPTDSVWKLAKQTP